MGWKTFESYRLCRLGARVCFLSFLVGCHLFGWLFEYFDMLVDWLVGGSGGWSAVTGGVRG